MKDEELLAEAGRRIISFVRDHVIDQYDRTERGEMRAAHFRALHVDLERFTESERARIREVVVHAVDATLATFLWMCEGREGFWLDTSIEGTGSRNLAEISDGLSGELWTEDGWIAKFSRFGRNKYSP
jgi:hypothetical protein